MTVKEHDSAASLLQQARKERHVRMARRLQAVAMAQKGLRSADMARLTGDSPRSVEHWAHRYNEQGVAGLREKPRSGRPPKWSADRQKDFCARVDHGPTHADRVGVLHGKDGQRILEQQFGVLYTLDGVYKLLHRLEYTWLMPRPRHEQADPLAQEVFKKRSA